MKNQRKIIGIFVLFFLFAIISTSYAAPLSPGQFNQNAVNDDTTGEILLIGGDTYTIPGAITINKTITIRSNDSSLNAIINLNNSRAFHILNSNGNLTLINITITNGTAQGAGTDGFGGAIFNNGGTLTVTGCTFNNNTATSDGGAIFNIGGTLTVTGSTFNNNTADTGGAIFNIVGTLNVTGSTFNNNTASLGGAIDNIGTLTVTGSTFNNNQARYGGAIYNDGTLTVTGSTFNNNQAESGGAIFSSTSGGDITIANCTFNNNSATTDHSGSGGAIYIQDRTVNITGCIFINNWSPSGGTAIYLWNGNLNVNLSAFYNNTPNPAIHRRDGTLNLTDNFFFNPNSINLTELKNQFTNNDSSIHGLYYFNISQNSVNTIGDVLKFDSLSYDGTGPSNIALLPDLDIISYYNGQPISYDYKSETKVIS